MKGGKTLLKLSNGMGWILTKASIFSFAGEAKSMTYGELEMDDTDTKMNGVFSSIKDNWK